MDQISDKQSVNVEINEILDSIPKKIEPEIILEVLATKAPNLKELLTNAQTKSEVENCLKDNSKSCENLISDPENRKNLNALLGKENQVAEAEIGNRYEQVRGQINDKYSVDISKILKSYDNPGDEIDEKNRILVNNKTKQVLAYSENLFKKLNPNAGPNDVQNGFASINFSNKDYNDFKNECLIDENLKGADLAKQINSCDEHVKVLVGRIDIEKNKIEEQTNTLRGKLDQLMNHNPKLERIEKLKQYIAQRYIRSCPQAKDSDSAFVSNILAIKCNVAESGTSSTGNIQDLSSSFSNILHRMQEGNSVSKTRGELGAFSKSEMGIYGEYCKGKITDSALVDICKDVVKENNRLANTRDTKDWDDFNKKYWVQYSSTSSKGYDVYEKKSNARIIGEGVSQSINTLYPVWFGNYQLNNQISMMTNQALYMKQLNYMNNPTSPWSLSNPFFQVNYFNTTGGFTGFANAAAPTTTATTTTPSTLNGFNFAK